MDLNVCSRRVHDGYATIRSRGRSRPRAVYRSDSEELLKESGGPYALPRVSNTPIVPDQIHQVPRWSDMGQDKLFENYGTLRRNPKREVEPPQEIITLNTFSNKKWQNQDQLIPNGNSKKDPISNDKEDCLYDSVPLEENFLSLNSFLRKTKVCENLHEQRQLQNGNLYEPEALRIVEQRCKIICTPEDNRFSESRGLAKSNVSHTADAGSQSCEVVDNKRESSEPNGRQPIYAIPNVAGLKNDRKNDQRPIVDGNYVPSGDLYRTTARYIEDINRNIAEIDKSYEELRSNSNNSAYGVITKNNSAYGKITKNSSLSQPQTLSLHRKRDMAPMLPISPHFGDNEDRTSSTSADSNHPTSPGRCSKNSNSRPNSYGKLPPKPLPRSSSIDSSCRHSTGSTSTTTESTDSLYAISESLTELAIDKILERRDQRRLQLGFEKEKVTKEAASSSDEDQMDRPLLTGTIRRNRVRVEAADDLQSSRKERNLFRKNNVQLCRRASERILDPSRRSREGVLLKENRPDDRRYGTLPCRRSKGAKPLHKSSEDVLDGERVPGSLQRSCMSTIDVSRHDEATFNGHTQPGTCLPLYLMDATDIILKGQLHRAQSRERQDRLLSQEQLQKLQPRRSENVFSGTLKASGRTRHKSLESEEEVRSSPDCQGFATLPRRGNVSKDRMVNDVPRRLSGTVPVLEPLYEHAVSDSVRPRDPQGVIPWWELATRKYRYRSCPSLQAHVVSAFEQSLSNMTQRLQQLTATAEKKDTELQELRDTIERLRKQSAEAGLNGGRRHTLGDSDSGTTGCTGNSNHQGSSIARQLSADSVTSLNSLSSACSVSSHHKKKGWLRSSFSKAFSRSRKNRHGSVSDAEDCKDGPGDLSAPNSPRLPTASKHEKSHDQNQTTRSNGKKSPEHDNSISGSKSSSALYKQEDEDVDELKKQLREKDMVLTDIRLEALSSAHQLESLKDTVIKMRNEMLNLKQNNERLQRLVTSKSLTSSQSSLPSDPERRFSMTEVASTVAALSNGDHNSRSDQLEDLNIPEQPVVPSATSTTTTEPAIEQDTDGKRINVAVYLGSEKSFNFNLGNSTEGGAGEPPHCVIASVCISNKTTWDSLDSTVRRCFKDYVTRVDPVTNLGLGVECIAAYHLGEASRCITESQHPELLPCGYMVGHIKSIYLVLSGYSWLAVDTLIPRSIVQRQVNHLTEHRRVILCGPSGTGKSYLAGKLAHALVDADMENKDAAAVATYNVDHKSSKELRQYLTHIAERCDSNAADELPRVIILENLQHAASLSELFSGLLGTRHSTCPAIIGTMSQATCSTTNLQLHHNFRWVLCANHMEPVKGFLGRYLRRKLLEHELRESGGARNAEMAAVVEWLPRVWLHLNKFLETHSSSDVTIGPRLFLSCPMEVSGSQVWFTDLWNYSVIPYLVEAVREGLTLYGRRASGSGNGDSVWEDPAQFIISSYPWISTHAVHGGSDALLRLRPEDVGYDVVTSGHSSGVGASSVKSLGSTHSDTEGDPLLNMLLRLQEAANYSSPHSNDSDSVTSMDSSHTRHSEDLSSSTSSSRGVESAL